MTKKHIKQLRLRTKKIGKLKKDKRLRKALPWLLLVAGVGFGFLFGISRPPNEHPNNLVWAVDSSVTIPDGLARFLHSQDDCKDYKGTNSPTGVGLWSVYQTSQNNFAKISYGCSTSISPYIMAVRDKGKWQLLPPTEYFAGGESILTNFLPKCSVVDKYRIDESMEPFCIDSSGSPQENSIR